MSFNESKPPRPRSKQRLHSSYNRTPVSDSLRGAMPIQCQYCSGQTFRRSRLRGDDFRQIAMMRYPVRCLRCSQRQYVSFTVAGISLASNTKHTREIRPQDTWKHWTARGDDSTAQQVIPQATQRTDE